jgi:hypothetical protein
MNRVPRKRVPMAQITPFSTMVAASAPKPDQVPAGGGGAREVTHEMLTDLTAGSVATIAVTKAFQRLADP